MIFEAGFSRLIFFPFLPPPFHHKEEEKIENFPSSFSLSFPSQKKKGMKEKMKSFPHFFLLLKKGKERGKKKNILIVSTRKIPVLLP